MLRRLLLPALVLGAAVAFDGAWVGDGVSARISHWSDAWLTPARALLGLRVIVAVAFLFAWRQRSGRAARAALVLALIGETLAGRWAPVGPETRWALAIMVPLDLAIVAWLREASLSSRPGLLRLGTLAIGATVASPPVVARLLAWSAEHDFGPLFDQRAVLAAFAIAAAALVLRLARRPQPVEAAWLGILAAYACVFVFDPGTDDRRIFLLAAGIVLVLALVERAIALAFEDPLTGLPGRAALEQRLAELGERYAIAMVDVDRFKRVNDRHGHDVGDEVLRWIAARLQAVGGGGIAYRYGGEEFAIVFAGKEVAQVKATLESLRASIADRPFVLRSPRSVKAKTKTGRAKRAASKRRTLAISVSIGLAGRTGRSKTPAAVLKSADRALYRAKRTGRNRLAVTTR